MDYSLLRNRHTVVIWWCLISHVSMTTVSIPDVRVRRRRRRGDLRRSHPPECPHEKINRKWAALLLLGGRGHKVGVPTSSDLPDWATPPLPSPPLPSPLLGAGVRQRGWKSGINFWFGKWKNDKKYIIKIHDSTIECCCEAALWADENNGIFLFFHHVSQFSLKTFVETNRI